MAYAASSDGPSLSQYLQVAKQLANLGSFIPGAGGYAGGVGNLLGLGSLWASDAPTDMKLGGTAMNLFQQAPQWANLATQIWPSLATMPAQGTGLVAPVAGSAAGAGAAGATAATAGSAALAGLAMLPFSAFFGGGPFKMFLPDSNDPQRLAARARRTREAGLLQGDLLGKLGNLSAPLRDHPNIRSGDALLSILEGNLSGDWFGTAHSWLPDPSLAPRAQALRQAGYRTMPVDTGHLNSWGEMMAGVGAGLMNPNLLMGPDEELRRYGQPSAVPRTFRGSELTDTAQQGAYGWSNLLGGNPDLILGTRGFGPYRNYFDTQQTVYPNGVSTDGGYTESQVVDTPYAGYMKQLQAYDPTLYAKVDQMNTAKRLEFEAMQQAWNGAP